MADADEKAKAERLAAAKKRVEQMKAKKAKKAGGSSKKATEEEAAPKEKSEPPPAEAAADADDDSGAVKEDDDEAEEAAAQPSAAEQSKARSLSFRKQSLSAGTAPPPLPSPGLGESAPEIYRKYVTRIEELEKENKRLAKESADAEKRWQKAEDELADLRDGEGDDAAAAGKGAGGSDGEVEKLKAEIASLQRQNAQLQARRHGHSPSISAGTPPQELTEQLAARTATIETMELEMSRLRAQVERLSSSAPVSEQVTALEERAARAERAAGQAQRELADLKRNLERASEKAVREGSERASAETKVRSLEREAAEAVEQRDREAKRAEALEKKATTLTTLHKEQDARTQALRREKEKAEKDATALRERLQTAEAELLKLRKREARDSGGTDDDAVDELEAEGRAPLEAKIRQLEAENTELKRGIWQERRREMQVGPDGETLFTEVELGSAGPLSPSQRRGPGGGIGDFFASGINALTGAGGGHVPHAGPEDDSLLDDDDDFEFDEAAFRRAQEEDAKKHLERIRETKRGLKNWEGWRLDLVDDRNGSGGGEGYGEIFEV
ncbi:hypothetical protein RB594_009033 [Gaeumannomyces avenae]